MKVTSSPQAHSLLAAAAAAIHTRPCTTQPANRRRLCMLVWPTCPQASSCSADSPHQHTAQPSANHGRPSSSNRRHRPSPAGTSGSAQPRTSFTCIGRARHEHETAAAAASPRCPSRERTHRENTPYEGPSSQPKEPPSTAPSPSFSQPSDYPLLSVSASVAFSSARAEHRDQSMDPCRDPRRKSRMPSGRPNFFTFLAFF